MAAEALAEPQREATHITPLNASEEPGAPRPDDRTRLVLRSDFRMRREPHFVSLWRVGDDAGAHDVVRLEPGMAILLSLFDGQRTAEDVSRAFSHVMSIPADAARAALTDFLEAHPDRLIPVDAPEHAGPRQFDPGSFIIPAGEVDVRARPGAPYTLVYCITTECVADCLYCYAETRRFGEPRRLLPLGRVLEFVDEVADLQVPGVVVSGGDPFTHPDVVEILGAMLERGIFVAASTKCEISEATAGRLADIGLSRLQVSIDSADQQVHEFLTRSPGLLSGSLNTVRRASAAGIRILVNAVLTAYNVEGMAQLVECLAAAGARSVRFSEYSRSLYRHRDDLFVSPEQMAKAQDTAQGLQARFPQMSIELGARPDPPFEQRAVCTAGLHQLAIYADGTVVPCDTAPSVGETVVGDLSRQSLKEIWDSGALLSLRYPSREVFAGTVCQTCEDFEACHCGLGRCFIKALQAYGRVFAPTPECPRAPASHVPLSAAEFFAVEGLCSAGPSDPR